MATYNEEIRFCCECDKAVAEIGMDVFCIRYGKKKGMFRRCKMCPGFEAKDKQDWDVVNGQYICR